MQFCFTRDSVSLVMPVTPGSYKWTQGRTMETINISALGNVYRPGGQARFSGSFDFLLPAQEYPWMEAGARADPQYYLTWLGTWVKDGVPVRLVITETEINSLVYLEEIAQAEQDGTGDRYVTVTLREHVDLLAAETANTAQNGVQTSSGGGTAQIYTIVKGDCLSVICRRFYGSGTAKYYNALAQYNGISNPHLIFPGRTLQIPTVAVLFGEPA